MQKKIWENCKKLKGNSIINLFLCSSCKKCLYSQGVRLCLQSVILYLKYWKILKKYSHLITVRSCLLIKHKNNNENAQFALIKLHKFIFGFSFSRKKRYITIYGKWKIETLICSLTGRSKNWSNIISIFNWQFAETGWAMHRSCRQEFRLKSD